MNTSTDKFNYLILIFGVSLITSVFAKFSDAVGIQSALLFLLGITFFFTINNNILKYKNYVLPLLFFVLYAVFSYYSADFQYNARNGIMLLSYCSCAYLLTGFLKPYDKRSILLIPVFIGLWLTIFLFASNVTFAGYMESAGALSKSTHATAGFLILALCLSFVFWQNERKIYIYTSFIILTAVILTKSFYAIGLAFLACGIFLFFMRSKIKIKTHLLVLPFLAVSAAAFYQAFKSGYFAPKIISWQTAVSVVKDNLLMGTGFCNYSVVSGSYAKIASADVSQTENLFLQLIAETGIPGLVLFAAILAVFFILAAKKIKNIENRVTHLPVMLAVIFFIAYNMFESTAFISTNMLVFFILLSFPLETSEIKTRKIKINTYIAILLIIPFLYILAVPFLALSDYKKGIMLFTVNKYTAACGQYLKALEKDALNPAYASKLSDAYFAISQKENTLLNLDKAIEYKKFALSLNKWEGKYYYDLAWLYKQKGEKRLASDNIIKALEMDPFDKQFMESYELVY
ncbi:MAG: O-antigen ligase family protein [Endomicrobium sp.]|nr:O-antigen ligase family protein [Endomicrobium sp.]